MVLQTAKNDKNEQRPKMKKKKHRRSYLQLEMNYQIRCVIIYKKKLKKKTHMMITLLYI